MANKCKKGYKKVGGRCVKNSASKRKDKINFEPIWLIISIVGVVAIIGIVIYGGSHGWFKSLTVINDGDIINYLNNQENIGSCTFSLSPDSIYVGDRTTGTIVDGKNVLCQVFAFDGTTWSKVFEGYTDSNGVLTDTRNINVVGNFVFRAICDLNGNNRVDTSDCLTNSQPLSVLAKESCTETDGGNNIDVPGITTFDGLGYMDSCLPVGQAVHEYWCEDGVLKEGNYACDYGEVCISSRSGGYCMKPDTEYDLGDTVYHNGASGTIVSGESGFEQIIDLTGIETGGDCYLGAKIKTDWDYASSGCSGIQGSEGVEWRLYDSSGLTWFVADTYPQSHSVDLCPLDWDGKTRWEFRMDKMLNLPTCDLDYTWEVEVYVCECNQ